MIELYFIQSLIFFNNVILNTPFRLCLTLPVAGCGCIHIADFASSTNDKNIHILLIFRRIMRSAQKVHQSAAECLLLIKEAIRVASSALTRGEGGRRHSVLLRTTAGAFKGFLQTHQTKISTTYLVGCGTRSELIVHIKFQFFYRQYKYKTKICCTKFKIQLQQRFGVKVNFNVAREGLTSLQIQSR